MPSQTNNQKPRHTLVKAIAIIIVWLILASLIFVNRFNIFDWWRLRNYQTPTTVQSLINDDSMTPLGATLFKINYPNIENSSTFNQNCPNYDIEQSLVLGCYHAIQEGIFLLNVNDPQLNGVMQVTAAHEMLHAAYDRLNQNQKNNVDKMLMDFYTKDVHNPVIINEINIYKKTEPGSVLNEMHSTFGTEIVNLPADLNAYYSQYFYNRVKIADYAISYQGALLSKQSQVNSDDQQLSVLKAQIQSVEADLSAKLSSINSIEAQLNNLKDSGNTSAYNAGVPSYNNLVNQYNDEVDQLQVQINQYNSLVNQRNSLALTENQLYQALSGQPTKIK